MIKTNFLGDEVPKKKKTLRLHCLCNYWFCYENGKENCPQVYLECKYKMEKTKMTKFIEAELESESESELESDIELELKSDTE